MLQGGVSIAGETFAEVIFDISGGGAKVQVKEAGNKAENAMPKTAILTIPEFGDFEGDIVWTDDEYIGIHFQVLDWLLDALVLLIRKNLTF